MNETCSDAAIPVAPSFSRSYRYYVLLVLTVVYFLNFIDRQIFWVLLPAIKSELQFSDTQLGILSGLAFALFYTTLAVPIAYLAERLNRRNIISVSISLWSLATAACALAGNFWSLFLARISVGIGEAGSAPPTMSMISDYFAGKERAGAIALLGSAVVIGAGVGFALGSYLENQLGWRGTFVAIGLPGVVIGLTCWLTVREPTRGQSDEITEVPTPNSLRETLRYVLTRPTFRWLVAAGSMQAFVGYSMLTWISSFFERTHGLSLIEIGFKLGLAVIVGGVIGLVPSGFIADRLARKDIRWYMRLAGIGMLLGSFALPAIYLSRTPMEGFIAFGIASGILNVCWSPMFTVCQGISPLRMRASAHATMFLILNVVGMGLGPVIIGGASDLLGALYGFTSEQGLRLALTPFLTGAALLSGIFFLIGARYIHADFVSPHPGHKPPPN
jgi:MFS family permease